MHSSLGEGIVAPTMSGDGQQQFSGAFNSEKLAKHYGPGHLMQPPFSPRHQLESVTDHDQRLIAG